ncbi:photosystem II reaction center W protein, chloroplastic isoform X1 [Hevea brasiliensis]|uniref:photosystem II reaction center W protein, chloroplastic isoform X1 n=1 Tax=Hevea brasiliensis TaxID=3981 RepID=UPI0025F6D872|nr:photosystem II reaction center W protein, chloroplastic isoform X1 [Hevea brasiliensis]
MATISAMTPTSSITRAILVQKRSAGISHSPVLVIGQLLPGLPAMALKGKVRCEKPFVKENGCNKGMTASLFAAVGAATMSSPTLALVDERMSTEGTGLPFGLSNNLLGWILLGVFGLIWAFYIVYTSTLDEDDDSGLSL